MGILPLLSSCLKLCRVLAEEAGGREERLPVTRGTGLCTIGGIEMKRHHRVPAGPAILAVLTALLSAGTAVDARAVELGAVITPFGINDFGAGMTPPPSTYGTFGTRGAYYSSNTFRDGSGNEINDLDLDVKSLALAYIYMTDLEILNGKYGFAAAVPLIDITGQVNVPVSGGTLSLGNSDLAIGDISFAPIILQWAAPPNTFVNAGLQIQAPTGHYDTAQTFNVGVNHWTISPFLGATYISDGGLELSTHAMLNFNTENPDTNYTSGIEYKQEFAIGQHFGPWTLGVGGYAYQQITDDEGSGITDGNRSRVFALGPAVSFFEPGKPLVTFHAYREFGAQNHAEGVNVALRVAMSF